MYTREDVDHAIALIAGGHVPAGRLVTAEFPLERAAEAFGVAGSGSLSKVHVEPQPAGTAR